MPSKIKGLSVRFPTDLREMLIKDSEANRRSQSDHVIFIVEQHFQERMREAELFSSRQLHVGREDDEVQHFVTPDPLPSVSVSKFRANARRGKTE